MRAYLDLETGGLRASDQILTIGIVRENEHLLIPVAIDPRKRITQGALRVNGIDPRTWQGYPLDEAMTIAARMLEGHSIIAHNARFDRSFMLHACTETGVRINARWGCTLDWSRRIPDLYLPSRKLAVLHEHLVGYAPESTHDALEDARSCMRIAQKLGELDPGEAHLRLT